MYTPERLDRSLTDIGDLRTQYERSDPVRPGLYLFFAVHEDGEKAVQMASERLSIQYNQDFSKLVHKYALAGTPDQCVARLKEYIDAGARTIMLNSACPGDYVEDNERLLAESVIPAFR